MTYTDANWAPPGVIFNSSSSSRRGPSSEYHKAHQVLAIIPSPFLGTKPTPSQDPPNATICPRLTLPTVDLVTTRLQIEMPAVRSIIGPTTLLIGSSPHRLRRLQCFREGNPLRLVYIGLWRAYIGLIGAVKGAF